jgi:hypothetical protein
VFFAGKSMPARITLCYVATRMREHRYLPSLLFWLHLLDLDQCCFNKTWQIARNRAMDAKGQKR